MRQIRSIGKRVLVLCEGQTEYLYAKGMKSDLPRNKQRAINVEIICPHKNDPLALVEKAKRLKKLSEKEHNIYDSIWLFFDNDNWPQLRRAFDAIAREGFRISYSSFCIEHWFLLHFVNSGRAFQSAPEVLSELKKYWPGYGKTGINFYKFLKSNLLEAKSRAQLINRNSENDTPIYLKNPFFTLPEFLEYLEEI